MVASDLGLLISGAAKASEIKRLVFVPSEGTTNFVFVQFRGDFEERLKDELKEVEDAHGVVVLFIYKMHSLSGLGKAEVSTELYPWARRGPDCCCKFNERSKSRSFWRQLLDCFLPYTWTYARGENRIEQEACKLSVLTRV